MERHHLRYFEFNRLAAAVEGKATRIDMEEPTANSEKRVQYLYAEDLETNSQRIIAVRELQPADLPTVFFTDDRLLSDGRLTRLRGSIKQKHTIKVDKDKPLYNQGPECNPWRYVADGPAATRASNFSDRISNMNATRDSNLIAVERKEHLVKAVWQHEHGKLSIRIRLVFDTNLDNAIVHKDICVCFSDRPFVKSPEVTVDTDWIRTKDDKLFPVAIRMNEYEGHAKRCSAVEEYSVRCCWIFDDEVKKDWFDKENVLPGVGDELYPRIKEAFTKKLTAEQLREFSR